MALGSKVARREGTRPAFAKWASIAWMPSAVLLACADASEAKASAATKLSAIMAEKFKGECAVGICSERQEGGGRKRRLGLVVASYTTRRHLQPDHLPFWDGSISVRCFDATRLPYADKRSVFQSLSLFRTLASCATGPPKLPRYAQNGF